MAIKRGYWTKELCQEEALKYESRKEFELKSPSGYGFATRQRIMDEICIHMDIIKKEKMFLKHEKMKEECLQEALKYEFIKDFRTKSHKYYDRAYKNGWMDYVCSHLKLITHPNGHWNKERCLEEALKYNNKRDFYTKSPKAYNASCDLDILKEICGHMISENKKPTKRLIYIISFNDDMFYIGLTENHKKRFKTHIKSGPVYKYYIKSGIEPKFECLTDYIDENLAAKLEIFLISEYRKSHINILNTQKGGGLGGRNKIHIGYDICKEEALKYINRSSFLQNSPKYYNISKKNNWLDEFFPFKNRIWDYISCKEEALKYKNRKEFQYNSGSAYGSCRRNGWLDEFFPKKTIINHWNYETCKEEASKFSNKTSFRKYSSSAYNISKKNNWLDVFFPYNSRKKYYWDYNTCLEESKKYSTVLEFKKKANSAYEFSRKNDWLEQFYTEKIKGNQHKIYWTYERCKEESKKHKTRNDLQIKCRGAYKTCIKNKWLNDFYPKKIWDYESCKLEASKYPNVSKFVKTSKTAYKVSKKNGWLDEFFPKILV